MCIFQYTDISLLLLSAVQYGKKDAVSMRGQKYERIKILFPHNFTNLPQNHVMCVMRACSVELDLTLQQKNILEEYVIRCLSVSPIDSSNFEYIIGLRHILCFSLTARSAQSFD